MEVLDILDILNTVFSLYLSWILFTSDIRQGGLEGPKNCIVFLPFWITKNFPCINAVPLHMMNYLNIQCTMTVGSQSICMVFQKE